MAKGFFDKVYSARTPSQSRDLYDDWSASYDADVRDSGYATPARCARALASIVTDTTTPILDFGCGTGLSGIALRAEGFENLHGMDISPEMLAKAEATQAYDRLTTISAEDPPPIATGQYAVIAAVGVIGAGAAPISVFHHLMNALGPGGRLVFSFNDHALADPENIAALDHWIETGAAEIAFEDYGDHLPKLGMKSRVYVLVKK